MKVIAAQHILVPVWQSGNMQEHQIVGKRFKSIECEPWIGLALLRLPLAWVGLPLAGVAPRLLAASLLPQLQQVPGRDLQCNVRRCNFKRIQCKPKLDWVALASFPHQLLLERRFLEEAAISKENQWKWKKF